MLLLLYESHFPSRPLWDNDLWKQHHMCENKKQEKDKTDPEPWSFIIVWYEIKICEVECNPF